MSYSIIKLFLSSFILCNFLQEHTHALRKAGICSFPSYSPNTVPQLLRIHKHTFFFSFGYAQILYSQIVVLNLQTYIVYLGGHSHGPNPSPSDLEIATNSHHDLLASVLGRYKICELYIFF